MKTYLVTGCAAFIGSNFVHYMLDKYEDIRLINLDKLTYAKQPGESAGHRERRPPHLCAGRYLRQGAGH